MERVTCSDPSDAAKGAAVFLSRKITETTTPLLLLLSGGSALKILDSLHPTLFSSRVTIGVLDERISLNPSVNNYFRLTIHPVIKQAITNGTAMIATMPLVNETPAILAARFEVSLRDWKVQHPEGKIIATVGMGPDGHTFGIMPASERLASQTADSGRPVDAADFDRLFVHTDHWVVGYNAGAKNPYPLRATTTVVFSREIDMSAWYVCGANKTDMLARALDPTTLVHEVPSRIMQDMKEVTLFTDCPVVR